MLQTGQNFNVIFFKFTVQYAVALEIWANICDEKLKESRACRSAKNALTTKLIGNYNTKKVSYQTVSKVISDRDSQLHCMSIVSGWHDKPESRLVKELSMILQSQDATGKAIHNVALKNLVAEHTRWTDTIKQWEAIQNDITFNPQNASGALSTNRVVEEGSPCCAIM